MRWDRFFEDLEQQLDFEQEAQRRALDGEAERLRVSRLELRTRLHALMGVELGVELAAAAVGREPGGAFARGTLRGVVAAVGADWLGIELGSGSGPGPGAAAIPLGAIRSLGLGRAALLASRGVAAGAAGAAGAAAGSAPGTTDPRPRAATLSERQSFGFLLRDLARRRRPVTLHDDGERVLHGTIDGVGADHLELALHERGAVRRRAEVSGYRIVPLHAVAWAQF